MLEQSAPQLLTTNHPIASHPMARFTPTYLHDKARRTSEVVLGPDRGAEIYCQRSTTGWHVYQQRGAGAQALQECMSPAECFQFLHGLAIGATIKAER